MWPTTTLRREPRQTLKLFSSPDPTDFRHSVPLTLAPCVPNGLFDDGNVAWGFSTSLEALVQRCDELDACLVESLEVLGLGEVEAGLCRIQTDTPNKAMAEVQPDTKEGTCGIWIDWAFQATLSGSRSSRIA